MKVSMCAGWGDERDGIADYSEYLVGALADKSVDIVKVRLGQYVEDDAFYVDAARHANETDICHVQFNYVYFNGALPYRNKFLCFARNLRIPLVITAHEVKAAFERLPEGIIYGVKRDIYNATLPIWNLCLHLYHGVMYRRADKVIVHTRLQEGHIRDCVKRKDKIILIPHGIPAVSEKDKTGSVAHAKAEFGFDGKTVLTIFGFINRRKGYEAALDALARLPENFILLIAGGPMRENDADRSYIKILEGMIEARRLSKRVKITGYVAKEAISSIMAATDICLAPFNSDSASGAMSLCIGYNKPIIASDIPVNKEINERFPCLELFRSISSEDLADKIKSLINNDSRIRSLTSFTRRYNEEFGYDRMAERIMCLYKEVAHAKI